VGDLDRRLDALVGGAPGGVDPKGALGVVTGALGDLDVVVDVDLRDPNGLVVRAFDGAVDIAGEGITVESDFSSRQSPGECAEQSTADGGDDVVQGGGPLRDAGGDVVVLAEGSLLAVDDRLGDFAEKGEPFLVLEDELVERVVLEVFGHVMPFDRGHGRGSCERADST
jgi:hypothetical protein